MEYFYKILNDPVFINLGFVYVSGFIAIRKISYIEHKIEYEIMKNYQINISQKLEGS